MKRLLIVALGLVLLTGLAVVIVGYPAGSEPLYTVAQVAAGVQRDPTAWAGRTVLVRGVAAPNLGPGCTIGPLWCGPIALTDPSPAHRQGRRVPVVGAILPGLRRVSWGQPATYRMRFQIVPRLSCTAAPCVAVTLLDAARRSALAPPAGLAGWVECVPLVSFHGGMVNCYRTVHLAAAERRLPVRPVNPVAAVRRVLHVGLTQALVLSGMGSAAPGPAIAVVYVFGTPEPACHLLRRGSCRSSYISVDEIVGHIAVVGVQVADDTRGVLGPWHLYANIPGRNLSLSIVSNAARRPVLEIARRILQQRAG